MSAREKSFGSDNHSGVHPKILSAIARANEGSAHAYGDDAFTRRAEAKFRKTFGPSTEVFFVFNGTGANVLSLRATLRPYQAVLCAPTAHIVTDECGAPEAWAGCKLIPLPEKDGKLTEGSREALVKALGEYRATFPHRVEPKVLSLSQTTELGGVYSVAEIRGWAELAHANGLIFHMDGARLANAAAALGCGLAELTSQAGVDVLSFGGTKNGLLFGEAVVFFRPGLSEGFAPLRKQGLQLASKMRFISAQFEALLTDELWRENARHSNQMAKRLAEEAAKVPGARITRPVEANAVFAILPREVADRARKEFFFYTWDEVSGEVRWMTAFDTTEADVSAFVDCLRRS